MRRRQKSLNMKSNKQNNVATKLQQYWTVSLSNHQRLICNSCDQFIQKRTLMISETLLQNQGKSQIHKWNHLFCYEVQNVHKRITNKKNFTQLLFGQQNLENQQDKAEVIEYIDLAFPKSQSSDSKDEKEAEASKGIRITRNRGKISQNQIKQKSVKSNKKYKKNKSKSKSNISKQKSNSPEIIQEKKKKKKKNYSDGYNSQQMAQFKKNLNQYMKLSISFLKQILTKNYQPKTGLKIDLAERCADGKVLGRIPQCSQCGGGKLRFNMKSGIYSCPGFMQDTTFKHCGRKFNKDQIKRMQWTE